MHMACVRLLVGALGCLLKMRDAAHAFVRHDDPKVGWSLRMDAAGNLEDIGLFFHCCAP